MDESKNNTKDDHIKKPAPKMIKIEEVDGAETKEPIATTGAKRQQSKSIDSDNRSDCTASPPHTYGGPESSYICRICDLTFHSPSDYAVHLRSHKEPLPTEQVKDNKGYLCKLCGKIFNSSASLERHGVAHTGEKPFRCKQCDMAFSTNNKLHRHMRSHKYGTNDGNNAYESDDSTASSTGGNDSRDPNQRFMRKRHIGDSNGDSESKRKIRTINNNFIKDAASQRLYCPVCNKDDFASIGILESHMENSHPEHEIKCVPCNVAFNNYRVLNLHRFMVHYQEHNILQTQNEKNMVRGLGDLAFVDFSGQKNPQIPRTISEKNSQKSLSEQCFKCDKCSQNFPSESVLQVHTQACVAHKLINLADGINEEVKRQDFFAQLDLQNKIDVNVAKENSTTKILNLPILQKELFMKNNDAMRLDGNKDLADIQSILNVTSAGGILDRLSNKIQGNHLTPLADINVKDNDTEETQDQFAAEFRKMKLRGEFPCRLCPAKFPNLRALKGHNRVHLSGNGPGPYRCNMCPHSSLDKAALIRHMRTHNGDRPYECAVCNYAFTTKANCERHLRNRHAKVTREDVKRSIIYHPSEDPNNDEVNSKLNICREEIKRSMIFNTPPDSDRREEQDQINDRSTPLSHYPREHTLNYIKEQNPNIHIPRDLSIIIPQPRDIMRNSSMSTSPTKTPQEEVLQPRIKVKGFGQLTQIPQFKDIPNERDPETEDELEQQSFEERPLNFSSDAPMDLSTYENNDDVLDLSKKKTDDSERNSGSEHEASGPQPLDFSENQTAAAVMFEKTQQFILAQQQLLNNVQIPKLDPASAFYANQLSQMYRSSLPGLAGLGLPGPFPINPYFMQHHPFLTPPGNAQDIADMKDRLHKEIIRGLQMSGGGLVPMDHSSIINSMTLASDRLQSFHLQNLNNTPPSPEISDHASIPTIKIEDEKPLHVNTESPIGTAFNSSTLHSPKSQKREAITTSHSPNSVKMVIKNGVLIPKQKQRRYRTERPFSCEHCSARFTLRSNMERHIKQQHPTYWSQRQRINIANLPRKNSLTMVPQNITVSNMSYDGRLNYLKSLNGGDGNMMNVENKDYLSNMHSNSNGHSINKSYDMISDQVKYALLAQHLNSHHSRNNFTNQIPDFHHDDQNSDHQVDDTNDDNDGEEEADTLVIDEEQPEEKPTNDFKPIAVDSEPEEQNLMAKKVANEILLGVSANQQELSKDFDLRIAGNFINKNMSQNNLPNPVLPTILSQFDKPKDEPMVNGDTKIKNNKDEADLVPVSRLLDNAITQLPFGQYFKAPTPDNSKSVVNSHQLGEGSEEDEEGLVASSGSTSEGNVSGSDENRSESDAANPQPEKKKSAYSLAPNRVSCPYCHRKFPWSSSLRRHVLTHTGQKPFKCPHCPLLFTTKSNCDRHLLRKHGGQGNTVTTQAIMTSPPHYPEAMANAIPIPELGNQGYIMRNVPERPYKCASCPSSTFSTLSNLKKHMSSKHGIIIIDSRPESPSQSRSENEDRANKDDHSTSDEEKSFKSENVEDLSANTKTTADTSQKSDWELQIPNKPSSNNSSDLVSNVLNSDSPYFKCHLCDGSFSDRQEALDHIKGNHFPDYELLMSKGALDASSSLGSEDISLQLTGNRSESCEEHEEENGDNIRRKFPDYANRKVICAFCMHSFWSAEDLRRHMRTHTGERPFSCDICRRRFTLKHSMLRHRKKHTTSTIASRRSTSCEDYSVASGDEEASSPSSGNTSNELQSPPSSVSNYPAIMKTSTPISGKMSSNPVTLNGYQFAICNKNVSISPEIPSNVNNNNSPPSYDKVDHVKIKLEQKMSRNRYSSDDLENQDGEMENGSDLIGKLLGISDKGMINKLLSSADEAAKLLGVNK